MLVGNVSGKVAVLIDDLADVSSNLYEKLTVDCSNISSRRTTPPSIWRNKSLRSADPRHPLILGYRPHQCILHR